MSYLVRTNKIYLSSYTTSTGKEMNSIVFVGFDENGVPKSGFQRSSIDLPGFPVFKGDVSGSDKKYPFHMIGTGNILKVYEGSIDALSHATMEKMEGKNYIEAHRISLGGLSGQPILQILSQYPEIAEIHLNLDNDDAGKEATTRLISLLKTNDFPEKQIFVNTSILKDWNEDLKVLVKSREIGDSPSP